jgi:NDP-sugar pyrophosphorylase family protein
MIGLIPAAGHATRIHGLPKFALPVPGGHLLGVLAKRMIAAGATKVYIGTNSTNFELVRRIAPEHSVVYAVDSETMNETLLAARTYFDVDEPVLFGMPDTYWTDEHVYPMLVHSLQMSTAGVAVWTTRPEQRSKMGMCRVVGTTANMEVYAVYDKPSRTTLIYGWGAIAWRRAFWQYIDAADLHIGFALQRAIENEEHPRAIIAGGSYYDCGTPDEYFACIRALVGEGVTA